ncbi:MAG: 50S ribosomal protein L28 [Ignavibacteriaceae bacterium]|nr:50S ribosomal protein L28 [Ignavibacteriaceae bacterium]
MARKCDLTGTIPMTGNHVSHAHNKTKRRFLPNLQKKRIWVSELNRFITVKLTAKGIKTLQKNGTAQIAKLVQQKAISAR